MPPLGHRCKMASERKQDWYFISILLVYLLSDSEQKPAGTPNMPEIMPVSGQLSALTPRRRGARQVIYSEFIECRGYMFMFTPVQSKRNLKSGFSMKQFFMFLTNFKYHTKRREEGLQGAFHPECLTTKHREQISHVIVAD